MKHAFLTLFFCAAALVAQGPPPVDAPADALKSAVGLTDAQVDQLKQLRKSEFEALKPVFEQFQAQIKQIREKYQAQALGVLTPDQKAKLAKLDEAEKQLQAIRQAHALGLLAPPDAGPGFRGPMGQGMRRGRMAPQQF